MENPPTPFPSDSTAGLTRETETRRDAPDPDNPPWGVGGALMLLFMSFALMVVTSLAFVIPYAMRRGVRLELLADFAIKDPGAVFLQIVSILPAHLLTLGLAWLLVTRAGKYPFFKTLGWEWGSRLTLWRCFWLALLLYAAGWALIQLSVKLLGPTDNALERILRSSRATALAAAFAASVTAPLVEEVVFRGLLYSALRRVVGVAAAVAIVLLIFAAIHVPQYWPSYGVIATILLLSVVLTLIRARTKNLLPCFFVHFVFNTVQAVLIVLTPYLQRYLPEEPPTAPVPPVPGLLAELFLRLLGAGP